eukprot:4284524-Prymnesium_polylepis.1
MPLLQRYVVHVHHRSTLRCEACAALTCALAVLPILLDWRMSSFSADALQGRVYLEHLRNVGSPLRPELVVVKIAVRRSNRKHQARAWVPAQGPGLEPMALTSQ